MDYGNKSNAYYRKVRSEMLEYLPQEPKKVLDVGCGKGSFACEVKQSTGAEVWGIEYMFKEASEAEKILDKVLAGPCEESIEQLPDQYFDVVFFNDVLEHLVDPSEVLARFRSKMTAGGRIVSSIPNIRYHNTLISILFKKDFKYQDHGVLDHTHLRFFTKKSIRRMYEENGYEIIRHEGINRSRSLKPLLYNIPLLFTHMDMFYPQYATVVKLIQ